ncbi:hypothetical protein BC628DRAFT_110711 [Trametes gibbosa]|nr:hypothetical protein BC628DRAFT_613923 [Trametes gibbosa]KAI0828313.1 hypothetical protein BC628DRAFT_110711 [Trametes gibbosa]
MRPWPTNGAAGSSSSQRECAHSTRAPRRPLRTPPDLSLPRLESSSRVCSERQIRTGRQGTTQHVSLQPGRPPGTRATAVNAITPLPNLERFSLSALSRASGFSPWPPGLTLAGSGRKTKQDWDKRKPRPAPLEPHETADTLCAPSSTPRSCRISVDLAYQNAASESNHGAPSQRRRECSWGRV